MCWEITVTLIGITLTFIVGVINIIVTLKQSNKNTFINTITIARKEYLATLRKTVAEFCAIAKSNNNLKFLVTEIGCGIAGFTVEQIAPLFKNALDENIENVYLPNSFYEVLTNEKTPNR